MEKLKSKPTAQKQIKGELYDTQGIEGLARVSDKKQTVKEHETSIIDIGEEKKLTGREWIIQVFNEWNYGESNLSFGTQELHHAIDLTEAEEREKCRHEWLDYYATQDTKVYMNGLEIGEEKGRRETVKEIDFFLGKYFENLIREAEDDFVPFEVIRDELSNRIKARFLPKEPKEKEAKP